MVNINHTFLNILKEKIFSFLSVFKFRRRYKFQGFVTKIWRAQAANEILKISEKTSLSLKTNVS